MIKPSDFISIIQEETLVSLNHYHKASQDLHSKDLYQGKVYQEQSFSACKCKPTQNLSHLQYVL